MNRDKKTTPSWTDVKTRLADFDRAGLIGLIQDLYAANKDNQAFLHARFSSASSGGSTAVEKVALFRRLFRGRTDVYPVRWEGKTSGKSGYAPACANEWRAGCLREAAHQVRRLRQPPADPADRCGDLRPPGRRAFCRRLSAAGG
jgi:hypothetical protein